MSVIPYRSRHLPEGTYRLSVNGVELGLYWLSFSAYAQDGSRQTHIEMPGIAAPGSVATYQIQFLPTPGAIS